MKRATYNIHIINKTTSMDKAHRKRRGDEAKKNVVKFDR